MTHTLPTSPAPRSMACRLLLGFSLLTWFALLCSPSQARWVYRLSYSGNSTATVSTIDYGEHLYAIGFPGLKAGDTTAKSSDQIDLSSISPSDSSDMDLHTEMTASVFGYDIIDGGSAQSQASGNIIIQVYWVPGPGGIDADPAPKTVTLSYRVSKVYAKDHVEIGGTLDTPGGHATSSATARMNSVTATADSQSVVNPGYVDQGDYGSDEDQNAQPEQPGKAKMNKKYTEVTPGSGNSPAYAEFQVPFSYDIRATVSGHYGALAEASVQLTLDCTLDPTDNPRGVGDHAPSGSDPSYTRWLPLAFSPHLTSQPFRTSAAAPIQGPWGNVSCMYSMTFTKDDNKDQSGARLAYNDFANDPGLRMPFSLSTASPVDHDTNGNPISTQPTYVLTDGNGDRLSFGLGMVPFKDVKSTPYAVADAGGNLTFTLKDAGPPGALKQKGPYTYSFQTLPFGVDGAVARLVQIQDDLGNTQTLNWATGQLTPYMTVTDSSSGRKLNFNMASGSGYFDQVDATLPGTNNPAVRTKLAYDGGGHLTKVQVTDGATGSVIRTDDFGYTDDAITYTAQNGAKTYTTFVDGPSKDHWGKAIKRMQSQALGVGNDTSSSDDGNSIQGTYSYSYGAINTARSAENFGVQGRTNTVTDANGNLTKSIDYYSYEDILENSQVILPPFSGADYNGTAGNIWKTFYVPDVTSPTSIVAKDPLLRSWTTTLDSQGNVTSTRDPLNHGVNMAWGGSTGHELQSVTDATGVASTFSYTPTGGRLSSVTDNAQKQQSALSYNSYGQLQSAVVPSATSASGSGEVTAYNYDGTTGDLMQMQSPDGAVTQVGQWDTTNHTLLPGTSYDPLGDPLAYTVFPDTGNPATSQTPLQMLLSWSASQDVVGVTYPNGLRQQNDYQNGLPTETRMLSPQNQVLAKETRAFDSRGRLSQVNDLVGLVEKYKYDKNSNLRRVIDGRGNPVEYTYGPNNELTRVTVGEPDVPGMGSSETFAYDVVGRLRESTDGRGVKTTYTYDAADRLKTIALPASANDGVVYTYDDADRLISAVRTNGDLVRYEYNHPNKWVTAVVTQVGNRTHRADYTYFADGKRQSLTSSVNGVVQQSVTYAYDVKGRMTQEVVSGYGTTTWQYDFMDRLLNQTTTTGVGGSFETEYEYGPSGMTADSFTAPAYLRAMRQYADGMFSSYLFTHDYLGRLTEVDEGGRNTRYQYDARGRLTSEQRWLQGIGHGFWHPFYTGTSTYTYDAADNLNGGANGWQYDDKNQLTSAPAVGGMPGATGITYGGGGLLSGMNGRTFQYNGWGQLVQINLPAASNTNGAPGGGSPPPPPPGGGGTVTIVYDPIGRVWSVTDKNGVTRNYDYDGTALLGEQSGGQSGAYKSYVQGADGYTGEYQVSSVVVGPVGGVDLSLFQFDPQGNTVGLYDETGNAKWNASNNFDAFGNPQEDERGPGASPVSSPPTAMVGNGSYRNPASGYRNSAEDGLNGDYDDGSGIDTDSLGTAGSWGQMYGRGLNLGYGNLRKLPSWQPGSPERRFESQTVQMMGLPGKLYTGYITATGYDPIAGECLSTKDRVLNGILLGVESAGAVGEAVTPVKPVKPATQPYEVGLYNDLKSRSRLTGLDIHHLPQANVGESGIANYGVSNDGLSIALPRRMHQTLPGTSRLRGDFSGISPEDARQLVSQQLRDLNNARLPLTDERVPKSALRQLGRRMRSTYPGLYISTKK